MYAVQGSGYGQFGVLVELPAELPPRSSIPKNCNEGRGRRDGGLVGWWDLPHLAPGMEKVSSMVPPQDLQNLAQLRSHCASTA